MIGAKAAAVAMAVNAAVEPAGTVTGGATTPVLVLSPSSLPHAAMRGVTVNKTRSRARRDPMAFISFFREDLP